MIDLLVLRGAMRCVESAAILTATGRHAEALKDVDLAITLLKGSIRDDYESACAMGLVVTEAIYDHNRDTRLSDDGEARR